LCEKKGCNFDLLFFFLCSSSKFRHVYGLPAKRQGCFENVKITRNAHDSSFCAANPKFLAVVVEVGGGGSFIVIPLDKAGRIDHTASKV
jgi:coronin-2